MKTIEYISYLLIPAFISIIIIYGIKKKVNVYENFLDGTIDGVKTAVKIFPTILAIIIAMTLFRESGALELLIKILEPVTKVLGIPREVLPLGFMSSISGGASLGILSDTLSVYGADSQIGRMASTILGSSETTLYVIAVYTAATKVKDCRGAIWIGLFCDFIALITAVWLCR